VNTLHKVILLAAWVGMHATVQAQADLRPGSAPIGAGNLRGGATLAQDPGSFYRDRGFFIGWGNSPIAPSDRFTDIVGQVGSVWQSSSGLSPYLFTAVELYATGASNPLSTHAFEPGSARLNFTFSHLLEGAYTLRFIGQSVENPDGFWPVNEWAYSFSAVASPAPEASELALSVLGLVAAVAWSHRRRAR
jgi:hypothetical protein